MPVRPQYNSDYYDCQLIVAHKKSKKDLVEWIAELRVHAKTSEDRYIASQGREKVCDFPCVYVIILKTSLGTRLENCEIE